MENRIPATYLQLNNITPLCVGNLNQSICNLFPNLQEEQNELYRERKRA